MYNTFTMKEPNGRKKISEPDARMRLAHLNRDEVRVIGPGKKYQDAGPPRGVIKPAHIVIIAYEGVKRKE